MRERTIGIHRGHALVASRERLLSLPAALLNRSTGDYLAAAAAALRRTMCRTMSPCLTRLNMASTSACVRLAVLSPLTKRIRSPKRVGGGSSQGKIEDNCRTIRH